MTNTKNTPIEAIERSIPVLRMLTPGGGGWGPPPSEPPETVA